MRTALTVGHAQTMNEVETDESRATKSRAWLWWGAIGALALITAAALFVAQVIVLLKYGTSCHVPAPVSSRQAGEVRLIVTASAATTLWLIGAWFGTRHGQRLAFMLGCTALATAPGWLYVIYGLTPAHWSDGFCF